MSDKPFGSIRFYTKTLEDMKAIAKLICRNPDEKIVKNEDHYELLQSTEKDKMNPAGFKKDVSKILNNVIEHAGVEADYKVVYYDAENPDENYIIHKGRAVSQQYPLPEEDSVNHTYQVIVIDVGADEIPGAYTLGWFDEPDPPVTIEVWYKGVKLTFDSVYLNVDADVDEIYENIDEGNYVVNLGLCSIFLAETVKEFHSLSSEEITRICVEKFKSDKSLWNEWKIDREGWGDVEKFPEGLRPEDLEFKVVSNKEIKSVFALEANNIYKNEYAELFFQEQLEEENNECEYKACENQKNMIENQDDLTEDQGEETREQYALPEEDSVDDTYQAIIIDKEEGNVALGWSGEDGAVQIEACFNGKIIYQNNVLLDVDATDDDVYDNLDEGSYSVKFDEIFLAETVEEFNNLTDEDITEFCVERFKNDAYFWKSWKKICLDSGDIEKLPEELRPEELKFKVIKH